MIFINNKYTKTYYKIIRRALSRENFGYIEKHHIIPKSLGGSNDKSNIVELTAKEHYICHLLLIRMTCGSARTKMRYAVYRFAHRNLFQSNREKITGRRYEYLREQLSLANKERPGPNKGKVMPKEQKEKISKALKGRKLEPRTPEHSAKLGQYVRTDAHREALIEARRLATGRDKRSKETKEKMSAWQKGVSKPKVKCEHCVKETSLMNYARWHGDNCKKKP